MSALIVDASVVVAVLIPEVDTAAAVDIIAGHEVLVGPPHLPAEVANALLVNARKGVISPIYRNSALERFLSLGIDIQPAVDASDTLRRVMSMADRHALTIYDAIYLEMASRQALPLASLDLALRQAARLEGVVVAPA